MTNNKSVLRYVGGKNRATKILDDIITNYFDITRYNTIISPFFGGGSFEFYVQNKYNKKLIVNDKYTPLYNFWNQIKINKNQLCNELYKRLNITKEQFNNYKQQIVNLDNNILEQAIQYFIINRSSYSGGTMCAGFSKDAAEKRFTKSSIDRINNLDFQNIDLYNLDFEEFLNKFDNDILYFVDPPYYLVKSNLYGNKGDLHKNFNHQKLFDILKNKKNWILTYNDCDYIINLYKDYKIIKTNWSYSMNKTKKSSEIIIIKFS